MSMRIGILLLGGAIAQALAAKDPDIETARLAYEEKRYDEAIEALQKAEERRGERAEIAFNQGLLRMVTQESDSARKLFERASEAENSELRASAWFELGNLSFDKKEWQGAIDSYIECLSANPQHEDAKWNLELALQKLEEEKQEQEKKDQQDKEQQDQEKDEQEKEEQEDKEQQDQENKDQEEQEKQDQEKQDQEEQGDQGQESESSSSSSGESTQGQQEQDEQASSSGDGDAKGQDQSSTEPEDQSSQQQEDKSQGGEPEAEEQEPPKEAPAPTQGAKSNLDRALEDLDRADPFMFGAPKQRRRRVKEDW